MSRFKNILALTCIYSAFAINEETQVIPLDRLGNSYRLDAWCNTNSPYRGFDQPKTSFLLNLNSPVTIISGKDKCFDFKNSDYHQMPVYGGKTNSPTEVTLPTTKFKGTSGETSCRIRRKNGKGSSIGTGFTFPILSTQTCGPYPDAREETKDQVGIIGLTPDVNFDIFNDKNKIESFGFNLPDLSRSDIKDIPGKMVFNVDFVGDKSLPKLLNTIKTDKKKYTFGALQEMVIGDSYKIVSSNINFAFDFNYPYIGVPSSIYADILLLLQKNGVLCIPMYKEKPLENLVSLPVCNYTGSFSALPKIILALKDEAVNPITLEPQQYIDMNVYRQKKQIKLRILSTVYSNTAPYYVKTMVTRDFYDKIILGSPYFEHRFVTFDIKNQEEPMVRIYESFHNLTSPEVTSDADKKPENDKNNDSGKWVTGVLIAICVILFVLLIAAGFFIYKRKAQNQQLQRQLNDQGNASYQAVNA